MRDAHKDKLASLATTQYSYTPGMKEDNKKLAEARTWAWASLVIGTLVLLGSIASFAWPFIPLQLFSVIWSLFFLYGGEQQMWYSVVMLGVVAAFELMGGAVTFLFALYFVAFPGQFGGFVLLIGIYALVFSPYRTGVSYVIQSKFSPKITN